MQAAHCKGGITTKKPDRSATVPICTRMSTNEIEQIDAIAKSAKISRYELIRSTIRAALML